MNREEMIDWLINAVLNADDGWYLSTILYEGFIGYRNYTDDQLRAEILERDDPDEVLEEISE